LGSSCRENGQSLVPEPPHMMTGRMLLTRGSRQAPIEAISCGRFDVSGESDAGYIALMNGTNEPSRGNMLKSRRKRRIASSPTTITSFP
jgi:hypothetical protein